MFLYILEFVDKNGKNLGTQPYEHENEDNCE